MPSPKGAKHLFPRNKGRKNSFAGTQDDKKLGLLQLLQQPRFCICRKVQGFRRAE